MMAALCAVVAVAGLLVMALVVGALLLLADAENQYNRRGK